MCVCVCVCVISVWMCVFGIYVCMNVDVVYNLILFQLRYIIFTCTLHANIWQQLWVVRMYVGCSRTHRFYFLFYEELIAAMLRVQRQAYFLCPSPPPLFFFFLVQCNLRYLCYCDICQNATVQFLGRDNKVILDFESLMLSKALPGS